MKSILSIFLLLFVCTFHVHACCFFLGRKTQEEIRLHENIKSASRLMQQKIDDDIEFFYNGRARLVCSLPCKVIAAFMAKDYDYCVEFAKENLEGNIASYFPSITDFGRDAPPDQEEIEVLNRRIHGIIRFVTFKDLGVKIPRPLLIKGISADDEKTRRILIFFSSLEMAMLRILKNRGEAYYF